MVNFHRYLCIAVSAQSGRPSHTPLWGCGARRSPESPEWAERILSWRHRGFNVHSRVRAKTKKEAERVGKYMIRPLLSLERLSLDEKRAQVGYRYGKDAQKMEGMDYLEFIARVTSHMNISHDFLLAWNERSS